MNRLMALLFGAALVGSAPSQAGDSGEKDGVSKSVRHAAMGLLTVYTFQFDPSSVSLRLLFPDQPGQLSEVRNMLGCQEAEACVNGSFFMESNRAIGLLVSEGKVLQAVRDVSWGMFWVGRNGKAHIDRRSEFEADVDLKDVDFAVQSGPTVMRDGVIRSDLGAGIARRVSIGLTKAGSVVLLVFPWPVSLAEMARFARDQVSVSTLMNLDGGGSTQLYVPGDGAMRVNGEPVAVGIGVFTR